MLILQDPMVNASDIDTRDFLSRTPNYSGTPEIRVEP